MGVERSLPGADRSRGWEGLAVFIAESVGGFGFVFEFEVGFFEWHIDAESWREAAVGVETDALWVDVIECVFDAGDDFFGRVDFFKATFDGAESDELVFGEFFENCEIACYGDAEFHDVLIDVDLLHGFDDGFVSAFGAPPLSSPVAAAEVEGGLDAVDAVEYFVDLIGGEIHFVAWVVEGVSVGGVDKHAQVGFVDLDDGYASVLEGEKLIVEDWDECVDELVAGRVGPRGDCLFPKSDSEQVGGGDAYFCKSVGGVYEEAGFLGDESGVDDLHRLGDGNAPSMGFLAEVGGESSGDIGDYVGVGVSAPFAVADEVESGLFLDGDCVLHGGVHAGGRGGAGGLNAGDVGEHFLDHEGAGEAADDGGGEGG